MSRIDELIAEHCPDGVRYVEAAQLFHLRNGYTPSKSNASFWSEGTIPWFRMEDIRANGGVLDRALQQIPEAAVKGGKLFPANSLLVATSATIGEHALVTVPHLSNQRFTSLSIKSEYADQVDMKFMYYYGFVLDEWCRNNTTTSSFASVDMTGFKKFRFPVPPLEVQREIVRVLDTFTALEAELEAELEARRRQYEHYQSEVFDQLDSAGVCRVAVKDLGRWYGGGTPSKGRSDYWVDGTIPWISPKDMGASVVLDTEDHITEAAVRNSATKLVPANAVALVARSSILDHTLPIAFVPSPSALNQDMKAVIAADGIEPRYVFRVLRANRERMLRSVRRSGGSVASLDSQKLWKFDVPVPRTEEQHRIVDFLDRFDSLTNDLSIGLPAELAARRKQYEYYRDKLLTFKESA